MRIILASSILLVLLCSPLLAQMPATTSSAPAAASPASGARELTLAQAEALALKNNPQITIGKLQALVARQYVREARSALLPNAYLSVTAVDSNPGSRLAPTLADPPTFSLALKPRPRPKTKTPRPRLLKLFSRSTSLFTMSWKPRLSSSSLSKPSIPANSLLTRSKPSPTPS